MSVSNILIFFQLLLITNEIQLNFYPSKNHLFTHCFYYKVLDNIVEYYKSDERFRTPYQIIPYCFVDEGVNVKIEMNIQSSMTFEQMRERKITVQDLLAWSAPIDLIENYESYFEFQDEKLLSEWYHNCSMPWFGRYCEFTFDSNDETFSELVTQTYVNTSSFTCYILMKCDRGPSPSCLDWREVCDGIVDCLEGTDEMNCLELEINECKENEYRCHQGMCIPEEFLNDSPYNPDCLDSSDENDYQRDPIDFSDIYLINQYSSALRYPNCFQDPSYRCEDTNHRLRTHPFNSICGDGQTSIRYIPHKLHRNMNFGENLDCQNNRVEIIEQSLVNYEHYPELNYECWYTFMCFTYIKDQDEHDNGCVDEFLYREPFDNECSHLDYMIFPSYPVFDGHVRFGYWLNQSFIVDPFSIFRRPDFICFDRQRCSFIQVDIILDNLTCTSLDTLNLYISEIPAFFQACNFIYKTGNETDCIDSSLFHCPNSTKCISKHRLLDGINDCYDGIDETYPNSCELNDRHRFSCTSEKKCISRYSVREGIDNCLDKEDENPRETKAKVHFPKLCNDYQSFMSDNETDETDCEQWPCDNIYTHCDGAWTCPNGADELNCDRTSPCYPDHHECISPKTFKLICLPLNQTGNGIHDCLGSMDERQHCRRQYYDTFENMYKCRNEDRCVNIYQGYHPELQCLDTSTCTEEKYFFFNAPSSDPEVFKECTNATLLIKTTVEKMNYDRILIENDHNNLLHFTLEQSNQFVPNGNDRNLPISIPTEEKKFRSNSNCNRGILIAFGQEKNESCLCPPSYYGDQCQFQNERVSLTLTFFKKCTSNCQGIYSLYMFLIDQTNLIHSYEQLTYITTKDCDIKYHFNFLYKSRPKNLTNTYRIHIDVYEKIDSNYYTSWIIPIVHLFLPVNRISTLLTIPSNPTDVTRQHCPLKCARDEQCRMYINTGEYFCQRILTRDQCNCSPSSICLGKMNHKSICLCPIDKIGPRCYLPSACQMNPCQNDGQCIPTADDFLCLCPDGYFGRTCQQKNIRIDISFGNINIPQAIFVYIVTVQNKTDPLIITILKRIPVDQNTLTVYTSTPYNLIFVRILSKYYLTFLQTKTQSLSVNAIKIQSSMYCMPVSDAFSETIMTYSFLRRVKLYHKICKDNRHLSCIHDNEHFMCQCNQDRFANCFPFNFQTNSTCLNRTQCNNDGQCLLNTPICPAYTMCECGDCFYGTKCQFTTEGSSLSLDVILSYHIRQKVPVSRQTMPVKISIILTTLFALMGLINGICSTSTFRTKTIREVACGLYLYVLSIVSFFTLTLFILKFCFLLVFQSSFITNRLIQKICCYSIDYLLESFVTIQDWLSVCVSIDRILIVTQPSNRSRNDRIKFARWTIPLIFVLVFISFIYEPLNQELIDDEGDHRMLCIIRYSLSIRIYNLIIRIIHFLIPFIIHIVSASIIIICVARNRSKAHKNQNYKQYLREQFRENKHLIISPSILVILALPRLIIAFLTGCMKSIRYPWLFLAAYFVSFLPPFVTSIIFILPSTTYKDQLKTNLKNIRKLFKRQNSYLYVFQKRE